MAKLVLLKLYYHKHDAGMAIGLLNDNGIEAILQSDDAGGFRHHLTLSMGNNRVMVQEEDAQKALEVIKVLEQQPSEEELNKIEEIAVHEPLESELKSSKKEKKNYTLVVLFVVIGLFICVYFLRGMTGAKGAPEYLVGSYKCLAASSGEYMTCKEFYRNNKVRWVGTLKKGQVVGKATEYFVEGSIRWKAEYTNGTLEGPFQEYYDDGTLRVKGFNKDGRLDGEYLVYFENGELKKKVNYQKGELDGEFEWYSKNGKVLKSLKFANGYLYDNIGNKYSGKNEVFYENGALFEETNYKKGKPEGVSRGYYEDGTVEWEQNSQNGTLDGEMKEFFRNGQLRYHYKFINSVPALATEYNLSGGVIYQVSQ